MCPSLPGISFLALDIRVVYACGGYRATGRRPLPVAHLAESGAGDEAIMSIAGHFSSRHALPLLARAHGGEAVGPSTRLQCQRPADERRNAEAERAGSKRSA